MKSTALIVIVPLAIGLAALCSRFRPEIAAEAAAPGVIASQAAQQTNQLAAPKPVKTWGDKTLPSASYHGFSYVQLWNASLIVKVGQDLGMPPRAAEIAVATAMQECQLYNCANDNPTYPLVVQRSLALPHEGVGHDHDSVGLFQQRPSYPEGELHNAWGTVAELMNKVTSAQKFYTKLKQVPNWQQLDLTVAAQSVQHSSFPTYYADDEPKAIAVIAYVMQYKAVV